LLHPLIPRLASWATTLSPARAGWIDDAVSL
jgi:hypothetical protein